MTKPDTVIASVPFNISGIPCTIAITGIGGWDDVYDWVICDRRGYAATWLARKVPQPALTRLVEAAVYQWKRNHKPD